MPAQTRPSLLVAGLAIALLAALAVIGYQLVSGGDNADQTAGSAPTGTQGTTSQTTGGDTTPLTGPAQASDLEHVMPAALLTGCTSGPTPANALATLDCTAQKRKGLSFQVSLYPNTDDVISAYRAILGAQGIAQNSDGCSQASWRGEREWLHPTGSLGGRVACYLDPTGDSVIVWIHMSKNQQGVAPQSDHRDILGVARQHTQLPGELLAWWSFWSGVKGTANIIGKVH